MNCLELLKSFFFFLAKLQSAEIQNETIRWVTSAIRIFGLKQREEVAQPNAFKTINISDKRSHFDFFLSLSFSNMIMNNCQDQNI